MKLGKSDTESSVEKITESRSIVKEIINFEINEAQKIDVIYFLALELENTGLMKDILKIIKKHRRRIKPDESAEYCNDMPDDNSSSSSKLLGV